jgi:hypothetical protein
MFISPFHYQIRTCISTGLFLCLPLIGSGQVQAWQQSKMLTNKTDKAKLTVKSWRSHLEQWGMDSSYNHAVAIGGRLNGNGWTGLIYYQHKLNRWQSHFFQLSFSEIKHEKQIKQERANTAFPQLESGLPFVFGKINNLYTIQLGHGREFLLLPGVLNGNINVSLRMQAGIALAMLKPYFLKLAYVTYDSSGNVQTANVQEEKYSKTNADKFLTTGYILGASKWCKGINEITYAPGAFADAAIVIEPQQNKTFIKTVTIGANCAFYSKELTLMADQKAKPYTATVFVGLSLGKRWQGK